MGVMAVTRTDDVIVSRGPDNCLVYADPRLLGGTIDMGMVISRTVGGGAPMFVVKGVSRLRLL